MIRWLMPPKLIEVAKYVECYWYLDKANGGVDRPKLNPDPAAHLILSLPNESYQYEVNDNVFEGKGSHWLYPHSNTMELNHTKSFACIGVKFKVGALYSLTNVPFAPSLLNTVHALNLDVFNGVSTSFEGELILKAKDEPDNCVELLDKILLSVIANSYEDKNSDITRKILPLLTDKPINELGEILSCSQRTLERSFLKVTGFTLKQCQSINKLEAILEYLYQREQSDIDWVDIAYQFGFSDQPHLIRYLKQHINLTPKNYTQQRGFTIDVYGGVESR